MQPSKCEHNGHCDNFRPNRQLRGIDTVQRLIGIFVRALLIVEGAPMNTMTSADNDGVGRFFHVNQQYLLIEYVNICIFR